MYIKRLVQQNISDFALLEFVPLAQSTVTLKKVSTTQNFLSRSGQLLHFCVDLTCLVSSFMVPTNFSLSLKLRQS